MVFSWFWLLDSTRTFSEYTVGLFKPIHRVRLLLSYIEKSSRSSLKWSPIHLVQEFQENQSIPLSPFERNCGHLDRRQCNAYLSKDFIETSIQELQISFSCTADMMMIVNLESWKVIVDDDAEINWRQVFPRSSSKEGDARSSSIRFERHPVSS